MVIYRLSFCENWTYFINECVEWRQSFKAVAHWLIQNFFEFCLFHIVLDGLATNCTHEGIEVFLRADGIECFL